MSRTQITALFSKFKGGMTSVTGMKHSGQPSRSRACENADQMKETVYKYRTITIHWNCLHVGNYLWESSKYFQKQSEHASDCYQIHAPPTEWDSDVESYQHLPGPSTAAWKKPWIPFKDNHRWWEMGLQVQPRNLVRLASVVEPIISTHKKHKTCLLKEENHCFPTYPPPPTLAQSHIMNFFFPQRQTVNQHYYTNMLCHLTSFPKSEMALNGRKFNDIIMIQAKLQNTLVGFQTVHFIQCSEQWHHCWAHCVKSQGNYSECDNSD